MGRSVKFHPQQDELFDLNNADLYHDFDEEQKAVFQREYAGQQAPRRSVSPGARVAASDMTGNRPLQQQALKWKAAKLREFEENEQLLERIAKQENDMRRQFEDSAQIMLQEQAKRERAAYIDELQRVQTESKLQSKNIAQEAVLAKNRNDKLNREVLDKEQLVLDLSNKLTL